MSTRREFVRYTSATLAAVAAPTSLVNAAGPPQIKSAIRRDETLVRYPCHGDIFPMTWVADGRQFLSFSDGTGISNPPQHYNTHGLWLDGDPNNATFRDLDTYPGYPDQQHKFTALYYGFGTLSVDNRLHHFLCCTQKDSESGWGWSGVKLIYSSDQGRTWHNQDGSTPVVWEPRESQSQKTMLFFEEPQSAFGLVGLLQMGKNYGDNRDGYVYGYGTNGNTDGLMNQLVMFRVPKARVLDRGAYEFFGGLKGNDRPTWVRDIQARAAVHTFPRGWVNKPRKGQNVVQSWVPSVVYNAPLGLYVMASSGVGCPSDGDWFGKYTASYLGLWSAANPWGPWRQIHEEKAWTPGNDAAARCYSPQIAPKWIAADGKSFWLVWSDLQAKAGSLTRVFEQSRSIKDPKEQARFAREQIPYYIFNAQRFDLVVG